MRAFAPAGTARPPRDPRRRRAAPAVLAASLVLTGCGAAHAVSGQDLSTAPVDGGSLTFIQQAEPSCLDPVIGGDMHQATFALQVLDSLVAQDDEGVIHPWLARSWEISDDGLEYTFELEEGVRFHDGTAFDAAAVKANFDRVLDPDGGAGGSASSYLVYVERTEVVAPHTVRVRLLRPFAPFLEFLAQSFLGIQSPAALERGRDANCRGPVGTGPFAVAKYVPGDHVVLERNEHYTTAPPTADHDGPPHVERVEWRFIPEPAPRYAAVRTGQAHAADGLSPLYEHATRDDARLAVIRHDYPGHPYGLTFNVTRPPFDDVRVRQAFAWSVDVDAGLRSIFFDLYQRIGVLSHTTPHATDQYVDDYRFDPERAASLLDAAGWDEIGPDGIRTRDGERLSVEWIYGATPELADYDTFAQQIQDTARRTGFEVVLAPIARNDYMARRMATDFDIMLNKWTLNSADVLRLLFSVDAIDTGGYRRNAALIRDEELDRLVEAAASTTDEDERARLYEEAQRHFSEQAYGIGLYTESVRIVSHARLVRGLRQEPALGLVTLQDAWVAQ